MTNQELKKKLKEKKEELNILYKISQTVSNNLDLNDVLKQIIEIVGQVTKADSCFLYLLVDDHLTLRASKNPHPKILGKVRLKLGEGLTGWAVKNKKSIAISRAAWTDKRFKFIKNLPEDKFEGFFALPVIYKDKVVGAINVQHKAPHKHSPEEKKFLEIIAGQVGGAISNAKLLAETISLKETLEARKLIEKAKGILMHDKKISEEEAYRLIHKKSMDLRKPMKEVAEAIILAWEVGK